MRLGDTRGKVLRRGGLLGGLLVLALLAFVIVRGVAAGRPPAAMAGEHACWVAIATQQAATFAASIRRVATATPATGARGTPTRPPASPQALAPTTNTPGGAPGVVPSLSPRALPITATRATTPSTLAATPADTPTARPALPTSGPTIPAVTAVAFVATGTVDAAEPVNLRSGPGTEYPPLGTLPPGTLVAATGEPTITAGVRWYLVQIADGRSGWIREVNIASLAP